jgi:hypothetical protein
MDKRASLLYNIFMTVIFSAINTFSQMGNPACRIVEDQAQYFWDRSDNIVFVFISDGSHNVAGRGRL